MKIIDKPYVKKQLNTISAFLLAIWFAYFLNGVSDYPYILGAVLYSILIYFSLIIILNKGYIINLSKSKYQNTGLDSSENKRILSELESLLKKDKIFEDNTIALPSFTQHITFLYSEIYFRKVEKHKKSKELLPMLTSKPTQSKVT